MMPLAQRSASAGEIRPTPERQAKGMMLPPLDCLLHAGQITAGQRAAGVELARCRRLVFGAGRTPGGHRSGRPPSEADLASVEAKLSHGRAAIGNLRAIRLVERVAIDEAGITSAEVPMLRSALARLAAAWTKDENPD